MTNLILLVGKALDSWAEQISKEHSEDMEREAKKRENVSIEEKKHNFPNKNNYEKWSGVKDFSCSKEAACYENYLDSMKEENIKKEEKRRKFDELIEKLGKNPPSKYTPPPIISVKADDKVIADKIDKMRMRQAADYEEKMERRNAEGRILTEKYNRINEAMVNRAFI